MNAWQFLQLLVPKNTIKNSAIMQDFDDEDVIELPQWQEMAQGVVPVAVEGAVFVQDAKEQHAFTKPKVTTTNA